MGPKIGARARYNLFETPLTPFFGAGLIYANGWGESGVIDVGGTGAGTVTIMPQPSSLRRSAAWSGLPSSGLAFRFDFGYALRLIQNIRASPGGQPSPPPTGRAWTSWSAAAS